MPNYQYKAKSGPGQIMEGTMTADSPNAVIAKLSEQGLFPISVEEESKVKKGVSIKSGRIAQRDVSLFTRQLADLLEGGLTLYQALDTLVNQMENKSFANIIGNIRDKVKEGNTLSESMRSYPKLFNLLYISMVLAGETGGMLDSVLQRIADFTEKDQELRSRVRSALTYPLFLGSFGIITIFVLVAFVVPKLTSIFTDFGQALPLPTKILIAASDFVTGWWWVMVIAIVAGIFMFRQQQKSVEGRIVLDKFKLKIPIVGKLIQISELARLSRTLSALFEGGVPVLKAIDIGTNTVLNEAIKRELIKVNEKISKGASIGMSLEEASYFPLFMVNMIKVGEKGGVIEKSLLKVADAYDKEVDRFTRMFTSLLEPIMIISLGLVVGFIVVSMLLPIFNINLVVR